MKKKYLIFSLALFLLLGITKVNAAPQQEYTSYKVGDSVLIDVTGSGWLSFYVIADSDSSNNEITAILSDTASPATYNYQNATNAIAAYGVEWKNAKEVRFPTAMELLGIDTEKLTESSTLSFLCNCLSSILATRNI